MVQRAHHRRRKRRLMGEINVVPYIDVMLVLLVIFMVTAPLLSTGVDVDLPQATAEPLEDDQNEPFVVTVTQEGKYYINDEAEQAVEDIAKIQLQAAAVLKHNPKTPFMVRGDRGVVYGKVIDALVKLQAAGVPNVGLVTDAPDS